MRASMAMKPLVFAIAATMAAGAWADSRDRRPHDPYLTWDAGAKAEVRNNQDMSGNFVNNEATKNTANADNVGNGSAGNLGVNLAGGNVNQQANEAALATADEAFIFGTAVASVNVTQNNHGNTVKNFSTQNNATGNGVANGASGNIGINLAAGNYIQQKNAMTAAVSGGRYVEAYAGATQSLGGAQVFNEANLKAEYKPVVLGVALGGGYVGGGVGVIHDEEPYKIEGGRKSDTIKSKYDPDPFGFVEAGAIALGGVASGWVPVGATVHQAVVNNASLSNSLNNSSGNVGANIAAGSHNQQINSLSIAAGCNACPK